MARFRFTFCLLALAAQYGISSAQSAPPRTLHLINVADVVDRNIGENVKRNAAEIAGLFGDIWDRAGFTSYNKIDVFSKKDDNGTRQPYCEDMNNAVANLKVGPLDTVVFYHSGHGQSAKKGLRIRNHHAFQRCNARRS